MRILIAEDDKKVAGFLQKGFKEEQYAVDICYDGDDVMYHIQTNPYDIILLDIMLPGKDGFTLCKEIRAASVVTPIMMLTARDHLEDKVKGLHMGADDYLTKPFAFEELLARIQALLRRSQNYKSGTLSVGDLILDPVNRTVTRSGKNITLTAKEYGLLEYLLRNKGRIVTQTMIIDHVWDVEYNGLSNVVNVYINHLREKVDKDFSVKYIHTVRGLGYKIDESSDV